MPHTPAADAEHGHTHAHPHDHAHPPGGASHVGGGHHGHHHAPTNFGRAFAIGIVLNLTYVVLEAGFGVVSGSLALMADAGHNLSDVCGLGLAWFAAILAKRGPSPLRTYGYKRGPILASLANAVILLVAVGAIVWEAIRRLITPEPVSTEVIVWVAAVGVLVNAGTAWLFMAGRSSDLNIRGAFLHMAADAAVTVGVIIAALLIGVTGWLWLDPAISLVIGVVIVVGTWGLLRDSVNLAMDAVPPGIDAAAVAAYLRSRPGVSEVHDLHIWGLSTTDTAMTAHLVRDDTTRDDALLHDVARDLKVRFGIHHMTVQLETQASADACELRPSDVI